MKLSKEEVPPAFQPLVAEVLASLQGVESQKPLPFPLDKVWDWLFREKSFQKLKRFAKRLTWTEKRKQVFFYIFSRKLARRLGTLDPKLYHWQRLIWEDRPFFSLSDFWELEQGEEFCLYLREVGRQLVGLFQLVSLFSTPSREKTPFSEIFDQELVKGQNWERITSTELLYWLEEPGIFEKRFLEGEILSYAVQVPPSREEVQIPFVFSFSHWGEIQKLLYPMERFQSLGWEEGSCKFSTLVLFFTVLLLKDLRRMFPKGVFLFPSFLKEVPLLLSFSHVAKERIQCGEGREKKIAFTFHFTLSPSRYPRRWVVEFPILRWQREGERLFQYLMQVRRRVFQNLASLVAL